MNREDLLNPTSSTLEFYLSPNTHKEVPEFNILFLFLWVYENWEVL